MPILVLQLIIKHLQCKMNPFSKNILFFGVGYPVVITNTTGRMRLYDRPCSAIRPYVLALAPVCIGTCARMSIVRSQL